MATAFRHDPHHSRIDLPRQPPTDSVLRRHYAQLQQMNAEVGMAGAMSSTGTRLMNWFRHLIHH